MSKRNTHGRALRQGSLAALVTAAGILGSTLMAPTASAATLGGVNMQLACDRQLLRDALDGDVGATMRH